MTEIRLLLALFPQEVTRKRSTGVSVSGRGALPSGYSAVGGQCHPGLAAQEEEVFVSLCPAFMTPYHGAGGVSRA